MCGITGFLMTGASLGRPEIQGLGRMMTDTLRHRGPDAHDVWQDPDVPLLLGHRRLSIIDLSPEGRQPMESFSGRYMIVYNGEIYNFPALKKELELAGVAFRGRSDTEVLLAAVEVYGLNLALQKLNGMFAFALWDRKEKTLHFVRDRFGKKPLYIGWAGKTLMFGSELKALRAHPDFSAQMNQAALSLYMKYGYVSAPQCIFENVWSLPAGHRLTVKLGAVDSGEDLSRHMQSYWDHWRALGDAKLKMDENKKDSEAVEEFSEILKAAVQDRMISDVPLGAFLSGGIDSSVVVALMQKHSGRPVKTYTIGFQEAGYDEAAHAKRIAAHLGTDHHEMYLEAKDALGVIPQLPEIFDEPFADVSAIPTYLVSKFAQADVTVALSGDGGDEMLGGYTRHIAGPRIWKRARLLPKPVRALIARKLQSVSTQKWDEYFSNRPQAGSAVHKAAAVFALDSQQQMYHHLAGQGGDMFLMQRNETQQDTHDVWRNTDLTFSEKMMFMDALFYLQNDILTKVDRASMAVSLETRAPLLDVRVYDYCWSLPEKFKIRNGKGKWLLREVLKNHLPEEHFNRPKQGFNMPVAEWLRGSLRDWAEDLLAREKTKDCFDAQEVSTAWQAHINGSGNHSGKLWTLLMFQAWKARWL